MVLGCLDKLALEVGVLVVERSVEAELVHQPFAFIVTTGNTNDARTAGLCNLSGHAARRTSRAGNNNELARLGVADLGHTDPGGQAREAEGGHHVLGVPEVGEQGLGLVPAGLEDGVLLPAGQAADEVAWLDLWVL